MATLLSRALEPKLFSSWGGETGSSSNVKRSSALASQGTDAAAPPRHVLPQDLSLAIRQLSDADLDRLVAAALEERTRRKKGPLPEQQKQRRDVEVVETSLPQGKLNAVKAAFKAGITPARIAREFGLSQADVRKALGK